MFVAQGQTNATCLNDDAFFWFLHRQQHDYVVLEK